jgi:hypothetical protein
MSTVARKGASVMSPPPATTPERPRLRRSVTGAPSASPDVPAPTVKVSLKRPSVVQSSFTVGLASARASPAVLCAAAFANPDVGPAR